MMTKRLQKCLFILIILLLPIALFACDPKPPKVIVPTSLDVYATETDLKKMEKGDTFEVACDIEPYDACQDIIWSVSNTNVASIDQNGLVTALGAGKFTIIATSAADASVYAEYKNEITVIDNTENYQKIDAVIEYLADLYPTNYVVSGYFELATSHDDYSDVTISWTSSNPTILPVSGLYSRTDKDNKVTLTARVKCGGVQKEYSFDAIVESLDKAGLKKLDDHKLVFMYLYSNLSSFTKTEVQGIDVINLSFALIDPTTHKLNLSGVNGKYNTVIKAHSYGIRVVLSIGGWGADGFSQACATKETRKVLIDDIMSALKTYHYDGIDLDWEYPTSKSAGISATTADKVNFTSFCTELRSAMDEYNPDLLLTAAVSGSETKYYEVGKLNDLFDYWHIMTYEYNSNAKSSYDSSYVQAKNGIDKWIRAGATNTKVVLGVTFYSSVYKVSSQTASDGIPCYGQTCASEPVHKDLSWVYPNIINDKYKYSVGYDSKNGMAYAYSYGSTDGYFTFASFDNAQSYKLKVEFIKSANLAGIMCWELGGDTSDRTQLKLLVNAMVKYSK